MKTAYLSILVSMFLLHTVARADQQAVVSSKSLNTGIANQAVMAAYDECGRRGYHVAVALTDRHGNLQAFTRSPLSGPHTIQVSQRKAFTATTYRISTSAMMERQHLAMSPGVLLVGGGLPINIAGNFYGAIAVSGAPGEKTPGDIDEACAQVGIDAITETLEFAND